MVSIFVMYRVLLYYCIGEFNNALTRSCSVCSDASFSDGVPVVMASDNSTCRPCPRFSVSSADGTGCVCGSGVLAGRRALIFVNGAPDDLSCIELMAPAERTLLLVFAIITSVAILAVAVFTFLWRVTRTMTAASPLFSLLFQVLFYLLVFLILFDTWFLFCQTYGLSSWVVSW